MKIKRYAHGEDDFWDLMGSYFASRSVRRELGIPMSSDENHVWFIAMGPESVAGFAAIETQKRGCFLRHVYVKADHREKGLMKKLVQEAVKYAKSISVSAIHVTVAAKLVDFYTENGWSESNTRGQYHTLILKLKEMS